jgi:hypothetical protein
MAFRYLCPNTENDGAIRRGAPADVTDWLSRYVVHGWRR